MYQETLHLIYFSSDIQYMFPTTVLNLVQKGLAAEESKMLPDYVSNWVQHEAIEQKYQPAYGTFRQALFCYAEDRIVPVLASILFNIDSFGNLGLLCREPEYTELWLNLFSKVTLISKKVSIKFSNPLFLCKFPFSDRIFREIEDALKNYISPGFVFLFLLNLFTFKSREKTFLFIK